MSKLRLFVLALASLFVVSTAHAGTFAEAVVAFDLGSGLASGFTNAATVRGVPTSSANPFNPAFRSTQLLSIGAGGYLTVQFSTPIANDPGQPYGLDFLIFGNSGCDHERQLFRRRHHRRLDLRNQSWVDARVRDSGQRDLLSVESVSSAGGRRIVPDRR